MRLPPLNALRAFEAAARHGSFVRAAEELHVTQGAVSRHVKLLEEHLNVPLFRRLPRGLELTSAAHLLLPKISASFAMIMEAATEIAETTRELKVIAPPTLANRWLIPRMARFKKKYPGIQVSVGLVHTSWSEYYRGNFDVGITCSELNYDRPAEFENALIRREILTPVCAPALMASEKPLKEPLDLKHHVLLHPYTEPYDWRKWLDLAGLSNAIDYRGGQTYETMEMAIHAAVGELGVAMADLHLVREELASGQLVTPFDLAVRDDTGYFLVWRRDCGDEAMIALFRDWVIAEAAADENMAAMEKPDRFSTDPRAPEDKTKRVSV